MGFVQFWKDFGNSFVDTMKGYGDFFGGVAKNMVNPDTYVNAFDNANKKFSDGWDQITRGAGLAGIGNMIGGVVYYLAPGFSWVKEASRQDMMENSEEIVDELGNVKYVASRSTDNFIVNLLRDMKRDSAAYDTNFRNALDDAMARGDVSTANELMGRNFGVVGLKTVSVAAGMAGVVLAPVTGGTSGALTLLAAGVTDVAADMVSDYMKNKLVEYDLETDVNRAVEDGVKKLVDEGRLDKDKADDYASVLSDFYMMESVNGAGMTGIMDTEDFNYLLETRGILKTVNGGEVEIDDLVALKEANIAEYREQFPEGTMTDDQISRMASAKTLAAVGQISQEEGLMRIAMIQYETFDITEAQAAELAALDVQLSLGDLDEESYCAAVFSNETLAPLINGNGELELYPKELKTATVEQKAFVASVADTVSGLDAATRDALGNSAFKPTLLGSAAMIRLGDPGKEPVAPSLADSGAIGIDVYEEEADRSGAPAIRLGDPGKEPAAEQRLSVAGPDV